MIYDAIFIFRKLLTVAIFIIYDDIVPNGSSKVDLLQSNINFLLGHTNDCELATELDPLITCINPFLTLIYLLYALW